MESRVLQADMTPEDFDRLVDLAYAGYFGCAAGDLAREGSTLLPRETWAGNGVIHIMHVRRRSLVEIDPGLQADLEPMQNRAISAEMLQCEWPSRIRSVDGGLVFHLRPGELVRVQPDPRILLRPLASADASALTALRSRCTPEESDETFVEVAHEITAGCFLDDLLVCAGSGYRRNGFMDFGVLTDPAFRGQRLARRVVEALSDATACLGVLAQYRCDRVNTASRRVAEGVGFRLYFTTDLMQVAA
jgi:RimJ/RimL family protein N-acetyltransferase